MEHCLQTEAPAAELRQNSFNTVYRVEKMFVPSQLDSYDGVKFSFGVEYK